MPAKPKIGFYWCASCGGCEEAVVDFAEDILGVVEAVDIVFWPCAMDFKKADVEAMPDQSILATLVNGAIRSSEQEEMAHLLRRKSQYLIAYGACAHLGGIPGLANQFAREHLLRFVFEEAPSVVNPNKVRPALDAEVKGHHLTLPELRHVVRTLDQVVAVDFYIPGCPPTPKITQAALKALLGGNLPPRGTVLARTLPLRAMPAESDQTCGLELCGGPPHSRYPQRPGGMLSGAGNRLHGAGHARRLRGRLHLWKHALHRLLRPHFEGAGPGREDFVIPVRQSRAQAGQGNCRGAGWNSRPGRHLLPLWIAQEPFASKSGPPGWQR
jgi:F420-non-reducing hydrogenase small subunit